MVAIKHPVLKKQFEEFSRLNSEAEKEVFWASFNKEFEDLPPHSQDEMRTDWEINISNVEKRLKALGSKIDKGISQIKVFPSNAEEAKLMVALLDRMGVRFEVV